MILSFHKFFFVKENKKQIDIFMMENSQRHGGQLVYLCKFETLWRIETLIWAKDRLIDRPAF